MGARKFRSAPAALIDVAGREQATTEVLRDYEKSMARKTSRAFEVLKRWQISKPARCIALPVGGVGRG